MHFLRVTEFYESSIDCFHQKVFEIVDFIDWYTTVYNKEGIFSYPDDWSGFNVSSKEFKKLYEDNKVTDWNRYDSFMYSVYRYVRCKEVDNEFYIIGILEGDDATFEHEFAHALYQICPEYKAEMNAHTRKIPKYQMTKLRTFLKEKFLYSERVILDEIQAYFSTGIKDTDIPKRYEKYTKPYVETYKKYRDLYLAK